MPGKGRIIQQEVYGHFKNKIKIIGNQEGLRKNYTKIDLGFSSLTDIIDLETTT